MTKKEKYAWGSMTWHLEDTEADMSVATMTLKADHRSDRHMHENCHEWLRVDSGKIIIGLEESTHMMQAGDSFLIPPGKYHHLYNCGIEEAAITLVYSAAKRNYTPEA